MKTAKVIVKGRVQGVFYRVWVKNAAQKMGLRGTVRNLDSGEVEAVFQGDKKIIQVMIDRCNEGSRLSRVKEVKVKWLQDEPVIEGFSILM